MNEKRTETMKNLPVSERPYEKAMEQGVEVLSCLLYTSDAADDS